MRRKVNHGSIWVLACFCALLGTDRILGQTAVWTGKGSDQNYSTPGNWQGGAVPPDTGADSVQFSQTGFGYVAIDTPANVSGLSFTSATYIYSTGSSSLTIGSGGVSLGAGFGYAELSVPIILSANQTWNAPTGTIYYYGTGISGAGSLTTNGTVYLNSTNTFTGGLTVASGFIYLETGSAAGTGTLTLSDNTHVLVSSVTIANPVTLGNNVTIGGNGSTAFTLSGAVTATNPATTLNLFGGSTVALSGSLIGATSPLALTITGNDSMLPSDYGSLLVVEGTLSNVASVNVSSASLILAPATAPGTAFASLLATGQLQVGNAGNQAYLGLDGRFTDVGAVSGFLATLGPTLGPAISGTLGFDTFANPASPNTFNDPISLSNFSSANFLGLGSATVAALGPSAVITPYNNTYLFGGGGGALTVQSALTDNGVTPRSLDMTWAPEPVTLILQSAVNTYTGGTVSNGGVLIFDSPTPTTTAGSIALQGGYVGYTQNATNMSLAQSFVGLFSTAADTNGVIGFDFGNPAVSRTVADAIDLSAFTGNNNIFLGPATAATLSGSITPANANYQFTGVKGGKLTVTSILSGANSVVVGLPNPIEANQSVSAVTLGGINTYSGGTTLNSGILYVTNSSSLGTGALMAQAYNSTLAPLGGSVTLGNPIALYPSLILGQNGNPNTLTLGGVISGNGALYIESNVVLNGLNTFLGNVYVNNSNVTLGSASALGGAQVDLWNSTLTESSLNPTLVDLNGSYSGDTQLAVNLAPGSTLTLNTDTNYTSYPAYYSGAINGDANTQVYKTGPGVQELGGSSTYGGGTTVSAGVLVASGSASLGTGTVTVLSGAELEVSSNATLPNALSLASGSIVSGTGTFASAGGATIANGTTVRPGHNFSGYASEHFLGTLSFSSVTLGGGGIYNFDIQNAGGIAGSDYSTLDVSGALTLSATPGSPFQITLTSIDPSTGTAGLATFNSSQAYSWTLVSAGSISGFNPGAFAFNASGFQNATNGGSLSVSEVGGMLELNFTPVPEPSTWVLMLAGVAALGARLHRSRRS